MTPGRAVLLGLVVGFVGGIGTWSSTQLRHRRSLFSPRLSERLAALGYLRGQPSLENARLLRDYVNWETEPVLRKRGTLVLRRMELSLDRDR